MLWLPTSSIALAAFVAVGYGQQLSNYWGMIGGLEDRGSGPSGQPQFVKGGKSLSEVVGLARRHPPPTTEARLAQRDVPTEYTKAPVKITPLTPQFFPDRDSKRVKVDYGPFIVPSMNIDNGMQNYVHYNSTVGCTNCTITWMRASLEYPNGTYANANTSLWLHHVVVFNLNQTDAVCGSPNQPYPDRFFASGNERSAVDLSLSGTDNAGYYIGPTDEIALTAELMNTALVNQTAIVSIVYEYIPGFPSDFHKITPIWLDIGTCLTGSEIPVPKNQNVFNYTSVPWKSTVTGKMVMAGGHVHDGGTHLAFNSNGKTICDSVATYGGDPGFLDPTDMGMNMSSMPTSAMPNMGKHISDLSGCSGVQINQGDGLGVQAFYDLNKYVAMTNMDGSLSPVMGIGLIYVAVGEKGTSNGTATATSTPKGTTIVSPTPTQSKTSGASKIVDTGSGLLLGVVAALWLL